MVPQDKGDLVCVDPDDRKVFFLVNTIENMITGAFGY